MKVIGLQRSGTNYLTELLKLNFKEFVYTDPLRPFFKHAMPYERFCRLKSGKLYEFPKSKTHLTNIIVIRKEVNHWLKSIERNPADLFQKRFSSVGNVPEQVLRNLHCMFYRFWKAEGVYMIRYEDLLKDMEKELNKIQKHFNLTPKQLPFKDINKVPHSKVFTEAKRQSYLQ